MLYDGGGTAGGHGGQPDWPRKEEEKKIQFFLNFFISLQLICFNISLDLSKNRVTRHAFLQLLNISSSIRSLVIRYQIHITYKYMKILTLANMAR